MASKRPIVLMGILLILVFGYLLQPSSRQHLFGPSAVPVEPPLPGTNNVSGLEVHREPDGRWLVSFDYFYTGDPPWAQVQVDVEVERKSVDAQPPMRLINSYAMAQRGRQQFRGEIQRPSSSEAVTVAQVVVRLHAGDRDVVTQRLAKRIEWPDQQTWALEREVASRPSDEILDKAVNLIDVGDRSTLREAKRLLERLITKDPRFDPGYVELARVAMKSNWGPEGLHQAETLLASARQIAPDSVNAKILLGYVYAHQGRYKPAQALFTEASQTDTRNLWLWANWGELLAMQGKPDQAIQKYREAVTRPRTHDTYDRARIDAYSNLLALLEQRKDLNAMEALHKQRVDEFGSGSCFGAEYAGFVLRQRGDAAAAIALARPALEARCWGLDARAVLGLGYYVTWAGAKGVERDNALNQARVFLPAGPRPLYLLAGSERTAGALQQLLAIGESIDQRDNDKLNALAHALQGKDLAAARRLLRLGARPDAPVGPGDVPVALLPVMEVDVAAVRVFQQAGVDYSKLRFQGGTAIDHAKRLGDRQLIDALERPTRGI